MTGRDYDLILFDIGGVLIEVAGVERMLRWAPYLDTADVMWHQWLTSPVVRAFESGRTTPQTFARQMIDEFRLPVSADRFLEEFQRWPVGLFAGAQALLERLSASHTLGVLSNTNHIHWELFETQMTFLDFFRYRFASHLTGHLKPDLESYHQVAFAAGLEPARILFLDDNQANVDGAREAGLEAYRVYGVTESRARLTALGLLQG
jgi:putative hydrolase of the HAD superfamily